MSMLNETHDPALRSWVPGSEPGDSDFPIQNLPLGVFSPPAAAPRIGVAIGDYIVDVAMLADQGLLDATPEVLPYCHEVILNPLMAAGPQVASALRRVLSRLLRVDAEHRQRTERCLIAMADAQLQLPVRISGFTDFFTSINHANNASRVFDPNKPELPNFRSLPIAYNGRASTVMVSGTPCLRPQGQVKPPGAQWPTFAPSRLLDYELEVGCYVGVAHPRGTPLALSDAEQHVFGLSLVNDWSARDIQGWEMMPLGPFLGKSFMTSVSPWVVTLEALAPFRIPAAPRGDTSVPLLPYLHAEQDQRRGGIAIELSVSLRTQAMRTSGAPAYCLGAPNFRDQFWTLFQMLTHHTSNGSNLQTGDLLASGTVSGNSRDQLGCLLELTEAGAQPVHLPNGELRRFLEDGDEVVMRGRCQRAGYVSIGFGECRGIVTPA